MNSDKFFFRVGAAAALGVGMVAGVLYYSLASSSCSSEDRKHIGASTMADDPGDSPNKKRF